jgi:hypothetical protein
MNWPLSDLMRERWRRMSFYEIVFALGTRFICINDANETRAMVTEHVLEGVVPSRAGTISLEQTCQCVFTARGFEIEDVIMAEINLHSSRCTRWRMQSVYPHYCSITTGIFIASLVADIGACCTRETAALSMGLARLKGTCLGRD